MKLGVKPVLLALEQAERAQCLRLKEQGKHCTSHLLTYSELTENYGGSRKGQMPP